MFQAVLDGASRIAWPKSAMNGSLEGRFNTQLKHIKRCCILLGLARGSPPTFDDCLLHLNVAGMNLHQLRERVMSEEGYRNRSEAACELLTLLNEDRETFHGTSTLGHLANLWPKPQVLFASHGGKEQIFAHRSWI